MAIEEKELTLKDAAEFLGISDAFISSLVNRGILPHVVRFGKKVVPIEALERRKRLAKLPIGERVSAGMLASPTFKTKQPEAEPSKKPAGKKAATKKSGKAAKKKPKSKGRRRGTV